MRRSAIVADARRARAPRRPAGGCGYSEAIIATSSRTERSRISEPVCSIAPIAPSSIASSGGRPNSETVPASGASQAEQHVDRGRLAGAVRAEQRHGLAGARSRRRCRAPRAPGPAGAERLHQAAQLDAGPGCDLGRRHAPESPKPVSLPAAGGTANVTIPARLGPGSVTAAGRILPRARPRAPPDRTLRRRDRGRAPGRLEVPARLVVLVGICAVVDRRIARRCQATSAAAPVARRRRLGRGAPAGGLPAGRRRARARGGAQGGAAAPGRPGRGQPGRAADRRRAGGRAPARRRTRRDRRRPRRGAHAGRAGVAQLGRRSSSSRRSTGSGRRWRSGSSTTAPPTAGSGRSRSSTR